jgi:Zn-finger nucleic acid-binding protein
VRCPRCNDVDLVRDAIEGLESCPACGGVSIDGAALLLACPSVAGLERRSLEIKLLGRRGEGILACPRCDETPFEFDVLDVPIDWCARCGAVWIDGDEREALSVRETGPEVETRKIKSAYRTDARAAFRAPRCVICRDLLTIAESYATEVGLICRVCRSRDDIDRAAPLVRKSTGWIAELYAWLRKVALALS